MSMADGLLPFAVVAAATSLLGTCASGASSAATGRRSRIPVILDTDIGDDIDDTWALGLILKSPELDLQLVIGDLGKSLYRARLIAKFLEAAGRTDVAVSVGLPPEEGVGGQAKWVEGYDLKSYPGQVHADGVQAIISTIMNSPQPVTLVAIGPMPNLAAALSREPRIATRARFVGMHGSVRLGYGGKPQPDAEYNVKANPDACRKVFAAPWNITITPLDTCGLVQLKDAKYAAVRDSKDPVARAIIENYRAWAAAGGNPQRADSASSILFDTVAVYLALAEELLQIENLGIRVTDDGMTMIDPTARTIRVATKWKDLAAFEDLLVQRLTGPTVKPAGEP